jgi:hypothetical protein
LEAGFYVLKSIFNNCIPFFCTVIIPEINKKLQASTFFFTTGPVELFKNPDPLDFFSQSDFDVNIVKRRLTKLNNNQTASIFSRSPKKKRNHQ